jgi:hypothetical protein
MKRIILLAAFVVLSLAAHAQHFDWVKSYTGSDRPGHVDNWIVGSVSDSQGNLYVLGMTTVNDEQHFGFHRYTGSEMAAHKAFVHVGGSQSARSLTMVFDDASGISDATRLNNKEQIKNNNWFTLDGRRLQAKPTAPGIYLNNGKKVIIK